MKNNKFLIIKIFIIATLFIIATVGGTVIYLHYQYTKDAIDIVEKPDEPEYVSPNATVSSTTEELLEHDDYKNSENALTKIEDTQQSDEQENIYKQNKIDDQIFNVLLIGMDARSYDKNSRSDTMILVSYNTKKNTVKMVSFMRDSWINIPGKSNNRLNAATLFGGPGLLINTINENFDLDIQNYIQIKFDDFRQIIDLFGGVDVDLTQQEINYINKKLHTDDHDYNNDITEGPGIIHLNGAQALWQCRNRSIGNADFERTERQREFLSLMITQARENITAASLIELAYGMKNYVSMNIDLETCIELGVSALTADNLEISTMRVPVDNSWSYANKNGASVIEINLDKNKEAIHDFLYPEEILNNN